VFADGLARYFQKGQLDDKTLRLLIMMNDGQPVLLP